MRLRSRPARTLVGVAVVTTALMTSGGPTSVLAASRGPVLGPSGLPAVQRSYPAGANPTHAESEPLVAPPASIADRDSIGDQLRYAHQAAALTVQDAGRRWENVGPLGQDDPPGYPTSVTRFARAAGMGVALAADPRDRSGNTIYTGTMGGLWKSTDGGQHYRHLGDGFARAAVGAIAVDPKRPDDVYVGTGIALLTISGDTAGTGVYVSHDAGRTFSRPVMNVKGYGTNVVTVTAAGVLVGTNRGLWRSTDHGASFVEVKLPSNAAHTGQATGAYSNWISSAVSNPGRPLEVTVAIGMGFGKKIGPDGKPLSPGNGLYRSTTGVAGPYAYLPSTAGLTNPGASADPIGRVALSYGAKNGETNVLWALVSDAGLQNKQSPGGLDLVGTTTGQSLNPTNSVLNGAYRSDDDGATWTLKANPQSLAASVNSSLVVLAGLGYGVGVQGFYNLWIAPDPISSDKVYLGLEEVFQSTANAGATPGLADFEVIQRYWDACGTATEFDNVYQGTTCPDGTPKYSGQSTHPDQHLGVAVPTDKGVRLYTGNDGGFYRQDSHVIDGGGTGYDNNSWTQMNTLASVQPWHVARKTDGEYLVANQDNGAGFFAKGKTETLVSSGDGIYTVATANPDVWYSSAQGLVLYVTKDHGHTITNINPGVAGAAFLSPFAVDPLDNNHLVAAGRDVMESLKGPDTKVLADPVAGTVVQTDWTQSFDAGTSTTTNLGKAVPYGSQALAVRGAAIYSAVCALCRNSLGDPTKITSTVATNVKPGCVAKKASKDCWHLAAGRGLPHVAIWSMAMDPSDTKTIYVVLNENSLVGLDPKVVGTPRVMVSHDAGEHFSDITGALPHSNARDVVVRNGQLVVATDNGVFVGPKDGRAWKRLGGGLPAVRIYDLDLDRSGRYLTASAYGRGVYVLDFAAKAVTSSSGPGPVTAPTRSTGGSTAVRASGHLAATGLATTVPLVAVGLLAAAALVARRRRRTT